MEEFKQLMEMEEKFRQVVGLLHIAEKERDAYKAALVSIRDSAVNVASIAEETLNVTA